MATVKYGPTISRAGRYRVRMRVNTDPVMLRTADALVEVGETLLRKVQPHVPDATEGTWYFGGQSGPRVAGKGLVTRGGVAGFALGKRVDHNSEVKTPRGFKPDKRGVDVAVGFGFPARFQETGTEHQPARPFLAPAGYQMGNEIRDEVRRAFPRRVL